jgi:NAD(P)-dependent dehydrogenase (short-subunit alcohol dehydrogenase family)
MFSLKDKVALVTGASQGIGRDIALTLSEAGAKVALAARNEEKLNALAEEIAAKGGEALVVKIDVSDPEQIKAGFKTVLEKFGKLDILVNNAAITRDGLALRMKADDWDAVRIVPQRRATRACIRTKLYQRHLESLLSPFAAATSMRRSTLIGWWMLVTSGIPARGSASSP